MFLKLVWNKQKVKGQFLKMSVAAAANIVLNLVTNTKVEILTRKSSPGGSSTLNYLDFLIIIIKVDSSKSYFV